MRASLRVAAALLLLCTLMPVVTVQAQDSNGLKDFHEAGYPTMILFTGVALLVGGIYFGLSRGEGDSKGSASALGPVFILLCLVDFILGVFLIFGPGAPQSSVQVNTLGLHLLVIAALGLYVAYTNARTHGKALFVIVVVTILALCGSMPLMNHTVPIWSISSLECLSYFLQTTDGLNRCKDTGYLQLLRTFGLFALGALLVQAFKLLEGLSSGESLSSSPASGGGAGGASARDSLLPGFGEHPAANVYAPPASSSASAGSAGASVAHPIIPQPYVAGTGNDNGSTLPQGSAYQAL